MCIPKLTSIYKLDIPQQGLSKVVFKRFQASDHTTAINKFKTTLKYWHPKISSSLNKRVLKANVKLTFKVSYMTG